MKITDFVKSNDNLGIVKYEQPDKINAIYFICSSDGEIVYIGKSANLIHRMSFHDKIFEGCLVYFFEISKEITIKKEKELIKSIKPKLNNCINGLYKNTK